MVGIHIRVMRTMCIFDQDVPNIVQECRHDQSVGPTLCLRESRGLERVLLLRDFLAEISVHTEVSEQLLDLRVHITHAACPSHASNTSLAIPKPVLAPLPLVTTTMRCCGDGASITQSTSAVG